MSRPLWLLALLCALSLAGPPRTPAARIPVIPEPGEAAASLPILFETVLPLNELPPAGWPESRRGQILYFLERMKQDDRIFLLIEVTVDPLGREEDNARWAADLAQAVGERLRETGVRPDRMLALPPRVDAGLFGEPRWEGFERRQRVRIVGLQGGPWLSRREVPSLVREELPPQGATEILEPAEGVTTRARHLLKGRTDESVRSVVVAVGEKVRTVAVYRGFFEVPVSLAKGENRIVVTGLDRYGRALRAVRTVTYRPPQPSIEIVSPPPDASADVSRDPVIVVRGTVRSAAPLQAVHLIQNDLPRPLRLGPDGTFEQRAVLLTDEDTFVVEGTDRAGETGVSAPRRVRAAGVAERPLLAILHWDEDGVDLDLHVTDRALHRTSFESPDRLRSAGAIPEGRMWIDERQGFGPEVFSIEGPAQGIYTFAVDYYRGRRPCRAYLTLVLFSGSPSRRMVRTFGPIPMAPGRRAVPVVQVELPAGTVVEMSPD